MSEPGGDTRALRPLWALAIGGAAAAGAATALPDAGPAWLHVASGIGGLTVLAFAVRHRRRASTSIWLLAGLLTVGGNALHHRSQTLEIERLLTATEPVAVRARMVIGDGWAESRWGRRVRVRLLRALRGRSAVPLPSRCRLEVRGEVRPLELPEPGTVVDGLVSIRGEAASPLLVASSIRLIVPTAARRLLPAAREALASRLLGAAALDVDRIRSAELAATLALGRRDLLPGERREGWRRSGLAHLLAVSGLHVGLVAGMAWLLMCALGAGPTTSRAVVLVLLPVYALLAGAAPSALRAALMGVIYLGARLAGRAIVPMAAVLLAAIALLAVDPTLIGEVSFQLTVLLTAALVRWAPSLTAALPGPRWLAAALAVPLIAQIAAAPLVAHHFASALPGAAAANLAVPWLLAPVVFAAVAATAVAPLWPAVGALLLDVVGAGERLLWIAGGPGRALELVPPPLPPAVMGLVVVSGLAALLPGRGAGRAAAAYAAILGLGAVWWLVIPPPHRTEVELLPVADGMAVRASAGGTHLLMDGGTRLREAAVGLSSVPVRRLAAVVASHGDADHIAGLGLILSTVKTDMLVVPAWLPAAPEAVPLLRLARRHQVRIVPVARGSRIDLGHLALDVLWPPAVAPPGPDNERSLVGRLDIGTGTVLLTADIGRGTERRLAASTRLTAAVLVIPHHGSRLSASPFLLDAVSPELALIPAAPENLHDHPHAEVRARLEARAIPYRAPILHGRCGARWMNGGWRLYPEPACRHP